jgi:hypothetical protein
MERAVPWPALCALIAPVYPKPGNGRPPVGVERMLRLYFLQHWFNPRSASLEPRGGMIVPREFRAIAESPAGPPFPADLQGVN